MTASGVENGKCRFTGAEPIMSTLIKWRIRRAISRIQERPRKKPVGERERVVFKRWRAAVSLLSLFARCEGDDPDREQLLGEAIEAIIGLLDYQSGEDACIDAGKASRHQRSPLRRCLVALLATSNDPSPYVRRLVDFICTWKHMSCETPVRLVLQELAPKSFPVLFEFLEKCRDPEKESWLMDVLSGAPHPNCFDVFAQALRRDEWYCRLQASRGLRRLGDPRGIPLIEESINELDKRNKPGGEEKIRDLENELDIFQRYLSVGTQCQECGGDMAREGETFHGLQLRTVVRCVKCGHTKTA